jgi:hypothetical protein
VRLSYDPTNDRKPFKAFSGKLATISDTKTFSLASKQADVTPNKEPADCAEIATLQTPDRPLCISSSSKHDNKLPIKVPSSPPRVSFKATLNDETMPGYLNPRPKPADPFTTQSSRIGKGFQAGKWPITDVLLKMC